jgi:hypothetical protein
MTSPVDDFDLDTSSAGAAIHAIWGATYRGRYTADDQSAWPAAPPRPQLSRAIHVHMRHTTVERVLDAIVAEHGALAWIVRTRSSGAPTTIELRQY